MSDDDKVKNMTIQMQDKTNLKVEKKEDFRLNQKSKRAEL